MSPQRRSLKDLIDQVRAQLKARIALRGAALTLAVAAVSLVSVSTAAGYISNRPSLLFALRIFPVISTLAAGWLFIVKPLAARIDEARIARLIEEKCGLSDSLVTAVEFSEDSRAASPAIIDRLIGDASERSGTIKVDRVIDPRHAYVYATASGLILLSLLAAFFIGPSSLSNGMAALYSSSDTAVSASSMFINVTPGSARAPRGSDQKIKAALNGFDSETAQVFIRKLDSSNWVAAQMEQAKNYGEFQFVIFNIQDSVTYYVESKDVRSPEFTLEVADLPFVNQIDLVLSFPAYTRMASKKIEKGGEVAALKGTSAQVIAHLSAGARAARIIFSDGAKIEMAAGGDNQFVGQFTVSQNGTYRIELTSADGERYNGSNEYDITVLEDHPPTVVIDKPGRDMKVTSIQEIFTQVRAEDDYGVAALELYFSVNGGEERSVRLQDLKSDSARALSGAHTFFLEEYGLQPGDFISYYAKARDNGSASEAREATSDIYFLEVRPFDREFRQAQQQGGGEGDQDSNQLTRRQREIIAATFRVQREQAQLTPQEKAENFDAVTLSQERLKTDTDTLAERIRRRFGDQLASQPDFAKLVEYLSQASKEMEAATVELRSRKTKEALAPEQRALQQLLRAEAIFRDMQIARGSGSSGSSNESAQELADLFELQLDKMKNQYETIQREQQAGQSQKQDEIARKLQELARRQQQQVEQKMRSQMQSNGGGSSARQQQEMIDEARQLARELERLSRDRRDPRLEETARQLQQAADEMQRAQAASSSSSQSGAGESTAQSLRALERLEQARRMLDSSQRAGSQQNLQQLRQQAQEALKRQNEITRDVGEMARSGQSGQVGQDKKQQLAERKQALADQVAGLGKDIEQAARGLGQDKQQASDKLREAAGLISRNRIPDRIRLNNQTIERGWYDEAQAREQTIQNSIEEVVKNLQAAQSSGSRRSQSESLEDALNQARELADNLDSLRRRIESERNQGQSQQGQSQQAQNSSSQSNGSQGEQAGAQQQGQQGQSNQQSQSGQQRGQSGQQGQSSRSQSQQARGQQGRQGQQAGNQQGQAGQQQSGGQQPGQQQSGQQQSGQSQAGQQASRQGGRFANGNAEEMTRAGGGPPRGGSRQLESELRQRLTEAEDLRRELGRNSDMARELNRAIEALRRIDPNAFSDPSQLALLKSEVIDPLRQLELELARRLQAKLGNNGPGALNDGDAPDRYRKMIEDYYRRLSSRSADARP